MKYHVRFDSGLSPDDVFDTAAEAHDFWLQNARESDRGYDLESVSRPRVGDFLTATDLVSAIRMGAAHFTRDDSFVDDDNFIAGADELLSVVRAAVNAWAESRGIQPNGWIVRGVTRIEREAS